MRGVWVALCLLPSSLWHELVYGRGQHPYVPKPRSLPCRRMSPMRVAWGVVFGAQIDAAGPTLSHCAQSPPVLGVRSIDAGSAGTRGMCARRGAVWASPLPGEIGNPGRALRLTGTMAPKPRGKRQANAAATAVVKEEDGQAAGSEDVPSQAAPPRKRGKTTVTCARCSVESVSDFSNFPVSKFAHNRIVVQGDFCKSCVEFGDAMGLNPEDMAKAEGKDQKLHSQRQEEQRDFERNRANPSLRTFMPEDMHLEVSSESIMREAFEFLPRPTFRDEFGVWPEDARVSQVRVTSARGDEVSGVLRSIPDANPELVLETRKRLVRKVPILTAADHHFADQVADRWLREARLSQRHFGQAPGGKYLPKLKASCAYSQEELAKAVETAKSKTAADPTMTGLKMLENAILLDPEEDEEGSRAADGDDEEGARPQVVVIRSRRAPKPGAGSSRSTAPSAARHAVDDAPGVEAGDCGAVKSSSTPMAKRQRDASPTPLLRRSGSRGLASAAGSSAGGPPSSAGEDDEETNGRVKSPTYWLNTVTTTAGFTGKSLTKQMGWMNSCANRIATADSVMANRVQKGQSPNMFLPGPRGVP